jgi:transaldolase
MELWLDTINFDLIKEATSLNIIQGVTTNPSILSRAEMDPETILKTLLDLQAGYVAAQVTEDSLEGMLKQARKLAALDKRMIVKIPAHTLGFQAMALLKQETIPTMATAIFEPEQVLFAAVCGAVYAAPYYGKMKTASPDAFKVLEKMQLIIKTQNYTLKLLSAAIPSAQEFVESAELGVAAITLPDLTYQALFQKKNNIQPYLDKFRSDWTLNKHTQNSLLFS